MAEAQGDPISHIPVRKQRHKTTGSRTIIIDDPVISNYTPDFIVALAEEVDDLGLLSLFALFSSSIPVTPATPHFCEGFFKPYLIQVHRRRFTFELIIKQGVGRATSMNS